MISGSGYFRWWLRLIGAEEKIEELQTENAGLRGKVATLETDREMLFQALNQLTVRVIHLENHGIQAPIYVVQQDNNQFLPANTYPTPNYIMPNGETR